MTVIPRVSPGSAVRRRVQAIILLVAALLSAGLLHAEPNGTGASAEPPVYVHDNAGKFSKDAIAQAERTIGELKSKHQHELIVETYPAIPDSMKEQFAAKGKERFFEDWAEKRFKAAGLNGVGVLICMDPRHLQVVVGNQTQKKLFTVSDRDELIRHLTAVLHDGKFDDGLTRTASFVLKKFDEHDAKDGDAKAATTAPSAQGKEADGPGSPVFSDIGDASRIIFLCDATGSMIGKIASLKNELQKAIDGLTPTQSFNVILIQDQKCHALDMSSLVSADAKAKRNAYKFLDDVTGEPSDPIPSLELAFRQHPQLIFLVTDGDFPDNKAVKDTISRLNADHKVKVNTIAFVNKDDGDTDFLTLLQEIARNTGGTYKRVREDELKD